METNLPQRRIPNNICRYISLQGVEINCLLQSVDFLTYFYRIEKPGKYHCKQEMKVNTTTEATRTSHILFYGMRRRQFTSVIFFPKSITSVLGKKYLTENIIQNT